MDLQQLLQETTAHIVALKEKCAEVETKLADAAVAADELAKAKFDEGFKAGIESVAAPTDKVYTQADLDAKIAEALAPVQAELEAVKAELAAVKAEVEAKIDAALAADAEADKAKVAQANEILATI